MIQTFDHTLPADPQDIRSYLPFARYIRWQDSEPHLEQCEQPIDRLDSLVAFNLRPWLPSYIELFYRVKNHLDEIFPPKHAFVFRCYINPIILTRSQLMVSTDYPTDKRDLIVDEMRLRKVDTVLHLSGMPPGKGFHFYNRDRDHIKFTHVA